MSNGLGALGTAFGSSFENVPNMGNNQQGGQQGNAGQQGMQGGDVPAFNLPPPPQMGQTFNDDYLRSLGSSAANNPGYPAPNMNPMGSTPSTNYPQQPQRKYTPEEWSRTFGPNVDPDPSMIQQGPQTPFDPMTALRGLGNRNTGLGGNPFAGGQGPRPQLSDDDYLRQLYMSELGRESDQGGMDYWRQQMAGGMGRDQVRQMFDQSQEGQGYNQRIAPMIDDFGQGQNPGYGPGVNNYGGPQMDPQIMDALRLAQQRQRPQGQPSQGIDQAQLSRILSGLGVF